MLSRRTLLLGLAASSLPETAMSARVKRFLGRDSFEVGARAAAVPLPSALVIPPGVYTFRGGAYDCTAEGRHEFVEFGVETQQRIVWAGDVHALMSAIAWICVNGRADESLGLADKTTRALTSKLRMLCSKTVEWAKYLTDSANIGLEARVARCLTGGVPNGYYDGHVMLEVKVGTSWVLYDLANNLRYAPLSGGGALKDVLPLASTTTREPLAADAGSAIEPAVPGAFDVTAWWEMTMQNPEDFDAEIERVLQIPGIDHTDGLTYFYLPPGMENRASYVTGLQESYRVIPKADWLARFYP